MAELPPGCVLGLTVDDPRLSLSAKRGKVTPDLHRTQGEHTHENGFTQCIYLSR